MAERPKPWLHERVRGAGLVVLLGLSVCASGLLLSAVFVWLLA